MTTSIGRESVLAALSERAPRSMHLAEICKRLGVSPADRDPVLDVLDDLSGIGLVKQLPGHRFRLDKRKKPPRAASPSRPPPPARDAIQPVVRGRFTQNPRGFGFVAGDDEGPDVFIPPGRAGGAVQGDRVEVRVFPTAEGREGEVLQVLERGTGLVTGTVYRAGRELLLQPDDERVPAPATIEGKVPREARAGVAVVARIVRYPQHARDRIEVRVVDVLGPHGETAVEVAKIKLREGIVEVFPADVAAEAEALPAKVTAADREGRVDLRDVELVTIDPPDARDHDDAVFVEKRPDGGYHVVVAVADVSHYVPEGGALDREASSRGCSIYLPDRAIPMLPPELSTELASLVPNKDRLCMAVECELSESGKLQSHRIVEGVMKSRAKLTYEGVARALGLGEEGTRDRNAERHLPALQTLLELARILRRARLKRGALDLDVAEAKVVLDPDSGDPVDVVRSRRDAGVREAYRMIEEMMLLANEVVATDLARRGVPTVYRVHGKPDEKKLAIFAEVASSMGFELGPDEALDPNALARTLRRAEGTDKANVLSWFLLRAMQQAVYDTKNIGHYGLALTEYLHFTSPIRRYPDLLVHRLMRQVLRGEQLDFATLRPRLRRAAAESSWLERRSMSVERDVVDLYRTLLMRDRIGETFKATVTGLSERGVYVAFDEPFVEAMIPTDRLADDFELDRLGTRLTGARTGLSYGLGDRFDVKLEAADLARRELRVVPEGHLPGPSFEESEEPVRDHPRHGPRRRPRARRPPRIHRHK